MAQVRKAIRRQIFPHDQPQSSRRGAPGGDWVMGQRAQGTGRIEFPSRVHCKYTSSHLPRSEQARPCRLGPASVGDAPMHVLRFEVEPEFASKAMAQAVASLSVQHHLWMPGRAAGEIDKARINAGSRFRIEIRIGLAETGPGTCPTAARAIGANPMCQLQPVSL